ncbi:hypothetical protein GCM10027030_10010 [Luteococcus sediminum]
MPKVVDEKVRARAVRLVQEHRAEYPTVSKALEAVARQEGVGKESLRRWVNQAEIDAGTRQGTGLSWKWCKWLHRPQGQEES